MRRDGPLRVDAFRAVLFVQSPANIRVYIMIERLQFLPQNLQVLLKGRGFIQRAPECSIVGVTYEHNRRWTIHCCGAIKTHRGVCVKNDRGHTIECCSFVGQLNVSFVILTKHFPGRISPSFPGKQKFVIVPGLCHDLLKIWNKTLSHTIIDLFWCKFFWL